MENRQELYLTGRVSVNQPASDVRIRGMGEAAMEIHLGGLSCLTTRFLVS